jgi:ATP-dependent protease ClpP protease subunit
MANLIFFGEIGTEITAESVSRTIAQLPPHEEIHIQLNSAGGSLQEAITIYNLLKTSQRRVSVEINGWALSAASLVAMAGDPIAMHENSLLMIDSCPMGNGRRQCQSTAGDGQCLGYG